MKFSTLLVLGSMVLAVPNVLAAPKKGLKGTKGVKNSRRSLHADGHHHKSKKNKLHGPTARSCDYSTKKPSYSDSNSKKQKNSQEVKFTCKASEPVIDTTSRGIFLDPVEIRDEIQYKVKTEKDGIGVKVEYSNEYKEEEGVNEFNDTKTTFEVVFDTLIEYAKGDNKLERTDEEQAYDWGNDIILQSFSLTDWNNFTNVTDSDDGVISYFGISSMDQVTEFNFTISRADIGEKVTANTMKIDVRISNFPWLRDDTNLALMSTVKSELKVEMTYNDEAEVQFDRNGNVEKPSKWTDTVYISFQDASMETGFVPFGDYSWEDEAVATQTNASTTVADMMAALCQTALLAQLEEQQSMARSSTANVSLPPGCEGTTLAPESIYIVEQEETIRVVGTSPPPAMFGYENHQHIAYSFVGARAQHAKEIYWDPEAGISYTDTSSSSAAASLTGGAPYYNTASTSTALRSILTNAFFLATGVFYLFL